MNSSGLFIATKTFLFRSKIMSHKFFLSSFSNPYALITSLKLSKHDNKKYKTRTHSKSNNSCPHMFSSPILLELQLTIGVESLSIFCTTFGMRFTLSPKLVGIFMDEISEEVSCLKIFGGRGVESLSARPPEEVKPFSCAHVWKSQPRLTFPKTILKFKL